ncbi:ComF family protein [Porphyromonas levii]|nr:phosphoribosyltransferase family protein [Porphyromonas levii]MBR8764579.1 hypothetical protein [Porphyromonas levii]MBR8774397.1 hypothetical protein [Porphyromonas levii]MBR8807278.1 hypothetical protein [Porphyromonas levii]
MKMKISSITEPIIDFLFPAYCIGCGERLNKGHRFVCPTCFDALPKHHGMELYYDASERLKGLVPFTEYQTDLIFKESSITQALIHKIKYSGFPSLSTELARMFAPTHLRLGHFSDTTMIVPVPLLKSRLHKRGYNQSAFIAQGLAEVYQLPVVEDVLYRKGQRGTQTKKGKEARWTHVQGAFFVPDSANISGKRILVVDDVLTTGATLVQAGRSLIDAGAESISFYTLALDVLL